MTTTSRTTADDIRRIVELATRAPSIHNTQPWRWRATGDGLELHADRSRQLLAADRMGRNLTISCGAALHHALVAASALGLETSTERFRADQPSTLLARITLAPGAPSDTANADLDVIERRSTDRRRFTSWPIPEETLRHLARTAQTGGTHAVPLVEVTERFQAELLVGRAAERQAADEEVRAEQREWVEHSSFDGVPANALPVAATTVQPNRFADDSLWDYGREVEGSDGLIVLFSAIDDATSWLAAGEGLSALWLAATARDLSVVPLSQVVEVDETRRALSEQVLGKLAHPLILVRIGWQPISRSHVQRTARRPLDDVLEGL